MSLWSPSYSKYFVQMWFTRKEKTWCWKPSWGSQETRKTASKKHLSPPLASWLYGWRFPPLYLVKGGTWLVEYLMAAVVLKNVATTWQQLVETLFLTLPALPLPQVQTWQKHQLIERSVNMSLLLREIHFLYILGYWSHPSQHWAPSLVPLPNKGRLSRGPLYVLY